VTRAQLEHLIRAAATIADDDDIVIIGSQAILGVFPDAPPELLVSVEADIYPRNKPERWDLIDGALGEMSPFHATFGYYAQGVDESTATLPAGWSDRLVPLFGPGTRGATGWCLEVHDLIVSKLVAGREKDLAFAAAAAHHGLARKSTLLDRLAGTPVDVERRELVRTRIERAFAAHGG
jgi:hypothetical protein